MPINYNNSNIPTSYVTYNVGNNESHTLPLKLEAIANAGFDAVELSMTDVLDYAKFLNGERPSPRDYDTLVDVGKRIRELAARQGMKIIMLQPFAKFEGWPKGSKEREDAFDRARGWMRVMEAVGTDLLQVGTSDADPDAICSSFDEFARDLGELADMMAEKGLRIAYENWCWAAHAPNWQDAWEIVKKVDRPNVGLCLDTWQSVGGEWADPTTASGLIESIPRAQLEQRWKQSLAELSSTVPADKIYLLQISDAYKMDPPLEAKLVKVNDEVGVRPPRGQWSRGNRSLPYDGGYLHRPVKEFLQAVLDTGFRGYLSLEVFDKKKSPDMPYYTQKSMNSLQKLVAECVSVRYHTPRL
ncbi:hypothetical protein PQX77_001116 [Marasmius sp. AFHP31]|nr:hypothetical protein PQX77_001116 [Marasmius sp. AFHP31]